MNKYNGAFFYSKEICKFFIPTIETDRNWVTLNIPGECADHSIMFIHNNLHPEKYEWLADFKDLILVCGIRETAQKVKHLGTPIVLPLSIDTEYVKQFAIPKKDKTKEIAFVGRKQKRCGVNFPPETVFLEDLPRTKLLPAMAEFKKIYGVGRVALEAKVLNSTVLPYDPRFPNTKRWKVLDSRDAAKMLQEKLNKIDGR